MNTPTRTSAFSIAVAFAVAVVAVLATPAAAEPKDDIPFVAATSRTSTIATPPSSVERLIAQEQARRGDPSVFGPSRPASVQIVEQPGGFDWGDAGIGGAATLALVLLAAGGMALRQESRRQGAHG
jgi:hypothetical protein